MSIPTDCLRTGEKNEITKCNILRDTGASQSLILEGTVYTGPETFTGIVQLPGSLGALLLYLYTR